QAGDEGVFLLHLRTAQRVYRVVGKLRHAMVRMRAQTVNITGVEETEGYLLVRHGAHKSSRPVRALQELPRQLFTQLRRNLGEGVEHGFSSSLLARPAKGRD